MKIFNGEYITINTEKICTSPKILQEMSAMFLLNIRLFIFPFLNIKLLFFLLSIYMHFHSLFNDTLREILYQWITQRTMNFQSIPQCFSVSKVFNYFIAFNPRLSVVFNYKLHHIYNSKTHATNNSNVKPFCIIRNMYGV